MDTLYNDGMNKNRTPALAEFRNAGYVVNIEHQRRFRVAYNDFKSGKIVVKIAMKPLEVLKPLNIDLDADGVLWEILPKGGQTEVTVFDPVSKLDFYAYSVCHSNENYNKRIGVEKCLRRISDLVLVCSLNEPTLTKFKEFLSQ